jgi:hypothetical protein
MGHSSSANARSGVSPTAARSSSITGLVNPAASARTASRRAAPGSADQKNAQIMALDEKRLDPGERA